MGTNCVQLLYLSRRNMNNGDEKHGRAEDAPTPPSVVFQAQRGANAVPMRYLVIFARGVTEAYPMRNLFERAFKR